MKAAIIYFPGNNCEKETLEAVKQAGLQGEIVRWNAKLKEYDAYIIPGGWSYEDRIRAGVIASKDPVMNTIKKESENGKPVLGICNGAQVLIESGLIPGLENKVQFALAPNNNPIISGYYNTWISIKTNAKCVFTKNLSKNEVLSLPIAHGEGRFITKDSSLLKDLEKNNQIVFQYCDNRGNTKDEFPTNPNGSIKNIAALSNKQGNVMAIMPHPERAIYNKQNPSLDNTDTHTNCLSIFTSLKNGN